jgi:hypothetical protein
MCQYQELYRPSAPYQVIEAATNLASPQVWLPVATNTIGDRGLWNFTNTTGALPRRFCRAREVE